MKTSSSRARRTRAAAERHYIQASQELDALWQELMTTEAPTERAELMQTAAGLQDQLAELLPAVYGPTIERILGQELPERLDGLAASAALLRQTAATELAVLLGGEYVPLRDERWIGTAGPDETLAWVELACSDNHADRAALLLKLAALLTPTLGATAAATLANLAESEVCLAAETGWEHIAGGQLSEAELAVAEPVRPGTVPSLETGRAGRARAGVVFEPLPPRLAARVYGLLAAIAAVPFLLGWPVRDQVVIAAAALAVAVYATGVRIRRGGRS